MTCIIAYKEPSSGKVWLGGDKLGSDGYTKIIVKDPKVFQNGEFYFGYTTSFYMGQILKYHWTRPTRSMHQDSDNEYIYKDVMNSLKKVFKDNEFGKSKDVHEPDFGNFIMVYKDRIFEVQPNMSLLECEDFIAVGCGAQTAHGVMDALINNTNHEPEKLIVETMKSVSRFMCGVSAECDVIKCF